MALSHPEGDSSSESFSRGREREGRGHCPQESWGQQLPSGRGAGRAQLGPRVSLSGEPQGHARPQEDSWTKPRFWPAQATRGIDLNCNLDNEGASGFLSLMQIEQAAEFRGEACLPPDAASCVLPKWPPSAHVSDHPPAARQPAPPRTRTRPAAEREMPGGPARVALCVASPAWPGRAAQLWFLRLPQPPAFLATFSPYFSLHSSAPAPPSVVCPPLLFLI